MRVLALSPYHGGSHRSFFEQWIASSAHDFTLETLPARHYPWRIRQASLGMADRAKARLAQGTEFDLILTTSMLDAAEFKGLLPPALHQLPLVVYFHENQLTYPVRKDEKSNQHFAFINWVTALAATENWFNSKHNLETFLKELELLLRQMPDEQSLSTVERILEKSRVEPLMVGSGPIREKEKGPLHIAWASRWEHDKRPDLFFDALTQLKSAGISFRLTCLGQSFRTWPDAFLKAKQSFAEEMEHFGTIESHSRYLDALGRCDAIVSTADHEFFGISLLEAVGLGVVPVVPDRLVYPEIYPAACRYGQTPLHLTEHLANLARRKEREGTLAEVYRSLGLYELAERYSPRLRAPQLDASLVRVTSAGREPC